MAQAWWEPRPSLWSETGSVTTDKAGVFSTTLGSDTPIDVRFDGPRWLEIEVEGESLSPRRELTSVPYAFQAMNSDSLGGLSSESYSLVGHTHDEYVTQGEVASITGEMIADGQMVPGTVTREALTTAIWEERPEVTMYRAAGPPVRTRGSKRVLRR